MIKVFTENRFFFAAYVMFLMLAGFTLMKIETGDLILWCSDNRSVFGNVFFKYGTRMGEEMVYILLAILGLFIRFRYTLWILLTGVLVSALSYLSKTYFQHPRPSLYFKKLKIFDQLNLIEGVELHSGGTSFPSGHTMSAFALYGLLALLLPYKKGVGVFLFLMAFMVGFSRIYLVQHFLKDIYLGSLMGIGIAILFYWLDQNVFRKEGHWINQSIPSLVNTNRSLAKS